MTKNEQYKYDKVLDAYKSGLTAAENNLGLDAHRIKLQNTSLDVTLITAEVEAMKKKGEALAVSCLNSDNMQQVNDYVSGLVTTPVTNFYDENTKTGDEQKISSHKVLYGLNTAFVDGIKSKLKSWGISHYTGKQFF
jgi:hypothetical protein